MKRMAGIKTKTYEAEYGFMVDIVDGYHWISINPSWEIYLYRAEFGTKEYMFGLPKGQTPTIKEVIEIVEANLPTYYKSYDDEFAEYDDVNRGYLEDYAEYFDDEDEHNCDEYE